MPPYASYAYLPHSYFLKLYSFSIGMHPIFRDIIGALGSCKITVSEILTCFLYGDRALSLLRIIAFDFISCILALNFWNPCAHPFSLSQFLHQVSNFAFPKTITYYYPPLTIYLKHTHFNKKLSSLPHRFSSSLRFLG